MKRTFIAALLLGVVFGLGSLVSSLLADCTLTPSSTPPSLDSLSPSTWTYSSSQTEIWKLSSFGCSSNYPPVNKCRVDLGLKLMFYDDALGGLRDWSTSETWASLQPSCNESGAMQFSHVIQWGSTADNGSYLKNQWVNYGSVTPWELLDWKVNSSVVYSGAVRVADPSPGQPYKFYQDSITGTISH